MANFDQLKQSVAALIRTNGAEEITGQIMQDVLLTIINSISGGYMFGGVAQHSGNVGNPDYNVFYLAGSGAYTGYGDAINIPNGCYGVFRYNGSWTQDVVDIGVHLTGTIREGETNGVTGDVINTALQQLFNNVMNILDTLTFTYNTPSAQQATKAMLDVIMTPTGGASHVFATLTLASATVAAAGLMSAEDKQKVDRMLTDFRSLSLTDTTAAADQATKIVQTLSATLGENPEAITTMTFLAATASKAGLLSAADKAKLDALWSSGYQFAGIATPSSTPMSTTAKIFYFATQAGTYTLFGDITLTDGINVLMYSGSAWSSAQLIGFDDSPTVFSKNLVTSDGIFADTLIAKSLTTNCFYIDPDHAASYNNGNFTHYGSYSNFDALWIRCLDGATGMRITGITPGTRGYFSELTPTPENCLGYGSENTIPEGTKLIIVDLGKNSNPNGYDNMKIYFNSRVYLEDEPEIYYSFKREQTRSKIAERGGASVDYKHLVNNPSSGVFNYAENSNYDCMWIPIFDKNITKITLHGFPTQSGLFTYYFFNAIKESEINTEHLIENNQTGRVPSGAVVCIVNSLRETHTEGYESCWVEYEMGYATNEYLDEVFGDHIVYQKNLINPDDLLYGYALNGSRPQPYTNGIMSNKITFVDGVTYAFQNIQYYGNAKKTYICHYNEDDEYIGWSSAIPTFDPESSRKVGNSLYKYSKDTRPGTAYCRVQLQTRYHDFHVEDGQIEVGTEFTEVVGYNAKQIFIPQGGGEEVSAHKKKIRFLMVGNSASQDALSYTPFIMGNMGVDVDFQLGILMQSSSTNTMHVENFNNEAEAYTFYLYDGGETWQNLGNKSIQWALERYQWDMISMQGTNMPENHADYIAADILANLISAYVDYGVKFIWFPHYIRPAKSNASISSGYNRSDAEINELYESSCARAQLELAQGLFEYVVPGNTAVQNARTIASIKALGAYATAPNNSSGLGYLACADGVHLQEGLPCQIEAYTFVMSFLDLYGFNNFSILGETTRVTTEWEQGKNIPGPHGECIGSTDENCLIAQKSVIMAMKKKFEVTDMNYIINPT